jgi:hypothetical protein
MRLFVRMMACHRFMRHGHLFCVQIDRLYGWKSAPDTPVRDAFKRQKDFVMKEFEQRSEAVFLQLNEQVSRLCNCKIQVQDVRCRMLSVTALLQCQLMYL